MKHALILSIIAFTACRGLSENVPAIDKEAATLSEGSPLQIYTCGLTGAGTERSRVRVARRWGFSYRAIAGCVMMGEVGDSISRHNRAVEDALARKHGSHWKGRFEKEVEEAFRLDRIIQSAASRNPTIVAAQASFDSAGKALLFEPGKQQANNRVEVFAYAHDQWDGKPAFVTQYMLVVDTATSHAEVVNNQRRFFRSLE